jgi:predicted deacetylase
VSLTEQLLCVSIHDVAAATWDDCQRLQVAVRAVADIPLTWLVVPCYHGSTQRSPVMEAQLGAALARGHELALHGYTHLDGAPGHGSARSRFLRTVYTQREGEFAALDTAEARRRIELGLGWFRQRDWPVYGFIPPAWLLGEQAWAALREYPFSYTTTFTRFHLLQGGRALFAPSLVYTARNGIGRGLSPLVMSAAALTLSRRPLMRLSLHPRDAHYPQLLRHAQRLLERLLDQRLALTKAACARRLTSTDPRNLRASGRWDSPPSRQDNSHSAGYPPWC